MTELRALARARRRPGSLLRIRQDGGPLRRFVSTKPHADRAEAALSAQHPAVRNGHTVFPKAVMDAAASPRLLVSGHNSPKLGKAVKKGAWAGMPIYLLSLEERATCPRSCHLWRECFGNSMPFARRHRPGAELEALLGAELVALAERHPTGFVVRLHNLGDFYSPRYAARWAVWLRALPELHVFGYTAHADDSPIANLIERMNGRWPDRCAIRFSRARPSGQAMEVTTVWRQPEGHRVPEGIVCPAQTGATDCCGTCGLCWAPAAFATPIVFIGHGRRTKGASA